MKKRIRNEEGFVKCYNCGETISEFEASMEIHDDGIRYFCSNDPDACLEREEKLKNGHYVDGVFVPNVV